jgi:hypothetical protein
MDEWVEVRPGVWERPVRVGAQQAVARVEREEPHGTTWAMRVVWNGAVQVHIGGYPSPAHARYDLGEGVVRALNGGASVEGSAAP